METYNLYHSLQSDVNHALDKLQHQNLLQQQTAHSIELDMQNLCLKIADLKNNQTELSENITKLSKLVKVEADLKDQLIAHLTKELEACRFLCKDSFTLYKHDQCCHEPVNNVIQKKYRTEENISDNIRHNLKNKKNSSSSDTCREKEKENNVGVLSKYNIFDKYKREVERKRTKKIEERKISIINPTNIGKKAKEINKTSKAIPKENQSVDKITNSKNTPNNVNVSHCNDKLAAKKENKLAENQPHLSIENNELNNKVSINKKTCVSDRSDIKAMNKLMEELKKLHEKSVAAKSGMKESKIVDNKSSEQKEKIDNFTKSKTEEITTNDLTCIDGAPENLKSRIDLVEIERTPNTTNIINKIIAQEMKNIDINANKLKSSLQEKQLVEDEEKIGQAKTTKRKIVKRVKKDTNSKLKTNPEEAPTRVLRSTLKRCNVNGQSDKLKKIDKLDKTKTLTVIPDVARNMKVSIPLKDCNFDDSIPVLHIPETENFVIEDCAADLVKTPKSNNESITAAPVEADRENFDINIDILKEDLNISFLDESDLQSSTNKVCSTNCSLDSLDKSLATHGVHDTSSDRRKRRRVVIKMVD